MTYSAEVLPRADQDVRRIDSEIAAGTATEAAGCFDNVPVLLGNLDLDPPRWGTVRESRCSPWRRGYAS